ncbi:MAG: aldehyde dehydrogenase family protein, partial [Alphaproteobacteria bacterium]|nr:aldehyde dehydrogenase family protein [Alphaproteobacteria bacterium]
AMVDDGAAMGEVYRAATPVPAGCFYPPTLITGLSAASRLMQEEIFGPVLVSMTFRTPAEAVELANNTRYGLAATVWTENVNLALDVAPRLKAGVVWVNGTNMFDAAAGFGGVRESGFGREGGWEGLLAYRKSAARPRAIKPIAAFPEPAAPEAPALDRTAKLYIGGKQARPDSGYSRAVWGPGGALLGHVGLGNRKDIRNAVEAAKKAEGWSKSAHHLRAQILYYIAENISARRDEFKKRLVEMTGATPAAAIKEVDESIRRLFTYAAFADKYDGDVHTPPARLVAVAMKESVGILGLVCPDEAPLLGFVSLFAPAMAMGNRSIIIPSEKHPLSATDFYQVFDTSDVPAGVVNIVTGDRASLTKTLAEHDEVDGIWYFGSDISGSALVEKSSVGNLKRTWVNNGRMRDWLDRDQSEGEEFLRHATEIKNIWVPYGE